MQCLECLPSVALWLLLGGFQVRVFRVVINSVAVPLLGCYRWLLGVRSYMSKFYI